MSFLFFRQGTKFNSTLALSSQATPDSTSFIVKNHYYILFTIKFLLWYCNYKIFALCLPVSGVKNADETSVSVNTLLQFSQLGLCLQCRVLYNMYSIQTDRHIHTQLHTHTTGMHNMLPPQNYLKILQSFILFSFLKFYKTILEESSGKYCKL